MVLMPEEKGFASVNIISIKNDLTCCMYLTCCMDSIMPVSII